MNEVIIEYLQDKYLYQTEKLIREYPGIFSKDEYEYFREDLLHNLLEKASHKKDLFVLILRMGDDVRGVAVIGRTKDSKNYYKVHWLIIKHEYQGKGYGTKLIKETFKFIREHGGMKEMAILPDFYNPPAHERHRPEDCIMFFKEL